MTDCASEPCKRCGSSSCTENARAMRDIDHADEVRQLEARIAALEEDVNVNAEQLDMRLRELATERGVRESVLAQLALEKDRADTLRTVAYNRGERILELEDEVMRLRNGDTK